MHKNKKIANVHDKFFRTVMSDPHIVKEFLEIHLPSDMRKEIDFQNL